MSDPDTLNPRHSDPPPASPKDEGVETGGGIPFMITGKKQALAALGWTAEAIANMKPATAHKVIARGLTAAAVAKTKPTPPADPNSPASDNDDDGDEQQQLPPKRGARGRPKLAVDNTNPGVDANNAKARAEAKAELKQRWPGGTNKETLNAKANMTNARAALLRLGCRCSFNRFKHRFVVEGPSECRITANSVVDLNIGEIHDNDITRLRGVLLQTFQFDAGDQHVYDAIKNLGVERQFHPVLDYLDGLKWDETKRMDGWLTKVFSTPNSIPSDYVIAVGNMFLIAAVRRVREPGCKFDTALVLEGRQGGGRSEALAILAVKPEWFSDIDVLGSPMKEQIELTEGVWINELGELNSVRKGRDIDKVKAYLSRQHDISRMSYGRVSERRARQCVFFGTINGDRYLHDLTGNRRFLPMPTGRIDKIWLRDNVHQLWAEAAVREREGASIVLPERLWRVAERIQRSRMVHNTWIDKLDKYKAKPGEIRRYFSNDLLEELGIPAANHNQFHWDKLKDAMHAIGFTGPDQIRIGKVRHQGYVMYGEGARGKADNRRDGEVDGDLPEGIDPDDTPF
jgi:predicted P-loop ATPase